MYISNLMTDSAFNKGIEQYRESKTWASSKNTDYLQGFVENTPLLVKVFFWTWGPFGTTRFSSRLEAAKEKLRKQSD